MGTSTPADWDDAQYLERNPDVAAAVAAGHFPNGWTHYVRHGQSEGRQGGWSMAAASGPATRLCFDPWIYLEVTAAHGLQPCCNIRPLATWTPGGPGIDELRAGPAFRTLRRDLLEGRLQQRCSACHIRPLVPVETFRSSLSNTLAAIAGDLLAPAPLRHLRIDVTSACNLRCVYCAVSQPWYRPQSMSDVAFEDILRLLEDEPRSLEIMVNGHGETTYHPQWLQLCRRIVDMGFRPSITTNLAKHLSAEEAACLARFSTVQVSLDSVDPEQLRQIRRKVKLSTILENLALIRAAASAAGVRPPSIAISCGVYDANYEGLPRVAAFCVAHGISAVTFWQLVKHEDLPGVPNVYPVPSLDRVRVAAAVAALEECLQILEKHKIATTVAGGFLDDWKGSLAAGRPE